MGHCFASAKEDEIKELTSVPSRRVVWQRYSPETEHTEHVRIEKWR